MTNIASGNQEFVNSLIGNIIERINAKLSNCWSNGEKLITFTMENIKGSNYCYIGDLGMSDLDKTHLTGCIDERIGFHRSLTDEKILYILEYLMKRWV